MKYFYKKVQNLSQKTKYLRIDGIDSNQNLPKTLKINEVLSTPWQPPKYAYAILPVACL